MQSIANERPPILSGCARRFSEAKASNSRGLALLTQANPNFENYWPTGQKNTYLRMIPGTRASEKAEVTGYDEYIQTLAEEMETYTLPTVFLHGDTHRFRVDQPLFSARTVGVSRTSRVLRPSAVRTLIGSELRLIQRTPRCSPSKLIQVQVYLGSLPATIEHIRAGKLRALAVTTSGLPDIPTVSDFVPGYEASQWFGAGLHKKTSTEIVNTLNKEINIALADAKMKARLADLGTTVFPGSGADLGKFVAEETDKWGAVVKSSGAKPD